MFALASVSFYLSLTLNFSSYSQHFVLSCIPPSQLAYSIGIVVAWPLTTYSCFPRYCFLVVVVNLQVQQYKHERECNAIIAQTREDKISRLESLMDGILPTEDFMDEEFISLTNEHKVSPIWFAYLFHYHFNKYLYVVFFP